MARDTLTGSRIRERRIMLGLKQSDLARRADISASYLNLIEHNRRRIGGKLLLDLAEILGVETTMLTEGAEATLIASLREAALDAPSAGAEVERLDEFAGRFPGWAALLAESRRKVVTLERTVSALNDRLAHDPHLAEVLHEVLTTVTAIRSTASILAEPGDIEPEWQQRFHRNINEDAARLADTSRALAQYLDTGDNPTSEIGSPQEEVDQFLSSYGFTFDAVESGRQSARAFVENNGRDLSDVARSLLTAIMLRYSADAERVPADMVRSDLQTIGVDPFALAAKWRVSPDVAMRRVAAQSVSAGLEAVSLVICDASGAPTYRQAAEGLQFPRYGAACTMLPLYESLSHPAYPIARRIEAPGANPVVLQAFAWSYPIQAPRADRPPLLEAHMLATRSSGSGDHPPVAVGVSCGICPREACEGRREPSILR